MQSDRSKQIDLNSEEMARFACHLTLPEFGLKGQKRLKSASILCVGSGGLGSPWPLVRLFSGVLGRYGPARVQDLAECSRQLVADSFVRRHLFLSHATRRAGGDRRLCAW